MVVFTLSHCGACPFPPWTHLNCSVMIIQRLYLCSTLVFGGSTDLLELYRLWKPCVRPSGLFMVVFTLSRHASGPSLHGSTSISLLQLYKGYVCVPHWCWLVAPIAWDFIGWWKPCCLGCSWCFHPVTLCYVPLPSMDPPQFLWYAYTKAIFVFQIVIRW